MERQLLDTLNSFRLPTGQPDFQRRRANLSVLSSGGLTRDEIRLLKHALARETMQVDIVAASPIELVIMMFHHLDIVDLWNCLAVSKTWRSILTHAQQVVSSLTDRLFPSLADGRYRRLLAGSGSSGSIPSFNPFLDAIRTSARRIEGRYLSKAEKRFQWSNECYFVADPGSYRDFEQFLPNPVVENPDYCSVTAPALYSHGKVAWGLGSLMVVDCLRTRARTMFAVPNLTTLAPHSYPAALGDKLLVAKANHYLFAWELATGRYERVTLPYLPARCATAGTNVTIVTLDGRLFVWKFQGGLREVDRLAPSAHGERRGWCGLMAHPESDDTLFMSAAQREPASSPPVFTVFEMKGKKLVNTFVYEIENDRWEKGDIEYVGFERASAFGHYTIGAFTWSGDRTEYAPSPDRVCVVQFDIYGKTFSHQYYDFPNIALSIRLGRWHLWNGRLTLNWNKDHGTATNKGPPGGSSGTRTASVRQIGPVASPGRRARGFAMPQHQRYFATDAAYSGANLPVSDDDYLLLVGKKGYSVWSFGSEDLELSTTAIVR